MNKNNNYTFNYFQPEEYHFSLDSVFLAQKVAAILNSHQDSFFQVLDLCAGSGIIGLELSLHTNAKLKIDFLEVQEIYHSFFVKNVEMIYPEIENKFEQFKFLIKNYNQLQTASFHNYYDLIVCNPPYFFKGEGLLSPSQFKNRCRFFIDSDFKTLIESIVHVLKPSGIAYLLVRSGAHHGRNGLEEINCILNHTGIAQIRDHLRGTQMVEIRKK